MSRVFLIALFATEVVGLSKCPLHRVLSGSCAKQNNVNTESVLRCQEAAGEYGYPSSKVTEVDSDGGVAVPGGCFYDVAAARLIVNHGRSNFLDCSGLLICLCLDPTCVDTEAPPTAVPTNPPPTPGPTAVPTQVPDTFAPTDPPKTDAPKTEAPRTEAPKTNVPKTTAPRTMPPVTEVPKTGVPVTDPPVTEVPRTEAPKTDVPTVAPRTDAPRTEVPKTAVPPLTPTPLVHSKVLWELPEASLPSSVVGEQGFTVRFSLAEGGRLNQTFFEALRARQVVDWAWTPLDVFDIATDVPVLSRGVGWALTNGKFQMKRAPTWWRTTGTTSMQVDIRVEGYRADMQEGIKFTLKTAAFDASTVVDTASRSHVITVEQAQQEVVAKAMVDTVSAVPAGQSIALLLDLQCGAAANNNLPPLMNPIGSPIMGSSCFGAVVYNNLLVSGLWLLQLLLSTLLLYVIKSQDKPLPFIPSYWNPVKIARAAEGLVRFPGGAVLGFFFFYQGQAKCTFVLLFDGFAEGQAAKIVVSALNLFVLVAVPVYVARQLRQGVKQNHCRYRVATSRDTPALMFILGRGEWVSRLRADPITYRYSMQLRPFTEKCCHFLVYDFLLMLLIGVGTAAPTSTYAECGHIRVGLSVACAGFLAMEIKLRPHARQRDNVVDAARLTFVSLGLLLVGVGFYLENLNHPVITVAAILFFITLLLLVVKLICDVGTEVYILYKRQRTRLQKAEWNEFDVDEDEEEGFVYNNLKSLKNDSFLNAKFAEMTPIAESEHDESPRRSSYSLDSLPVPDTPSNSYATTPTARKRPPRKATIRDPSDVAYSVEDAVAAIQAKMEAALDSSGGSSSTSSTAVSALDPEHLAREDSKLPPDVQDIEQLIRIAKQTEFMPCVSIARIRKLYSENPDLTHEEVRQDDTRHPQTAENISRYITLAKRPDGRIYNPEEATACLHELLTEDPALSLPELRALDVALPQGKVLPRLVKIARDRIKNEYSESDGVEAVKTINKQRREDGDGEASADELKQSDTRMPRDARRLDTIMRLAAGRSRPYEDVEALQVVKSAMRDNSWTYDSIRTADPRLPQRKEALIRLIKLAETNRELYDEPTSVSVIRGLLAETPDTTPTEMLQKDIALPQSAAEIRRLMLIGERGISPQQAQSRRISNTSFAPMRKVSSITTDDPKKNFRRTRTWTGLLADLAQVEVGNVNTEANNNLPPSPHSDTYDSLEANPADFGNISGHSNNTNVSSSSGMVSSPRVQRTPKKGRRFHAGAGPLVGGSGGTAPPRSRVSFGLDTGSSLGTPPPVRGSILPRGRSEKGGVLSSGPNVDDLI